jgi:hypothetical protein
MTDTVVHGSPSISEVEYETHSLYF